MNKKSRLYGSNPAAGMMARLAREEAESKLAQQKRAEQSQKILDGAMDYEEANTRMQAAALVQDWADTTPDELDSGETMADRLIALIVGSVAPDADGDLTEDEAALANTTMQLCADYMAQCGVSDADISAVFDDGDDDAAARVASLIEGSADDDADDDSRDNFAFGDDENAPALDSILDASYRMKMVVHGGKKLRVNKRISGTVHLSGAQKIAIRKARMKSHSAGARIKRMKSLRLRTKMGMPA